MRTQLIATGRTHLCQCMLAAGLLVTQMLGCGLEDTDGGEEREAMSRDARYECWKNCDPDPYPFETIEQCNADCLHFWEKDWRSPRNVQPYNKIFSSSTSSITLSCDRAGDSIHPATRYEFSLEYLLNPNDSPDAAKPYATYVVTKPSKVFYPQVHTRYRLRVRAKISGPEGWSGWSDWSIPAWFELK